MYFSSMLLPISAYFSNSVTVTVSSVSVAAESVVVATNVSTFSSSFAAYAVENAQVKTVAAAMTKASVFFQVMMNIPFAKNLWASSPGYTSRSNRYFV